jgi:hypothetical protein
LLLTIAAAAYVTAIALWLVFLMLNGALLAAVPKIWRASTIPIGRFRYKARTLLARHKRTMVPVFAVFSVLLFAYNPFKRAILVMCIILYIELAALLFLHGLKRR